MSVEHAIELMLRLTNILSELDDNILADPNVLRLRPMLFNIVSRLPANPADCANNAGTPAASTPNADIIADADENTPGDRSLAVQDRAGAVLADIHEPYLLPSEIRPLYDPDPTPKSSRKAEDRALGILLRSFKSRPDEDYLEAFRDIAQLSLSVSSISTPSREADTLTNHQERVYCRHNILSQITGQNLASNAINRLFHSIEAIKFASDWSATVGSGSRNWKNTFYKTTFLRTANVSIDLGDAEIANLLSGDLKTEYSTWRRQQERKVTARNRLLHLYNTFGAGVLVDPFWNVDNLAGRHTADFRQVVDLIATHLPGTRGEDGQYTAAETRRNLHRCGGKAAIAIARVLSGEPCAAHVRHFLHQYPPEWTPL
ncbi:hypothetical protein K474DRAFT_1669222 [Panus rudis PR-1116 ss-1]|nr:hypothetical protein K474DRAFT_1669222 [Panus rudis PR-1116 ss-1]